jgi:hypothetical protein
MYIRRLFAILAMALFLLPQVFAEGRPVLKGPNGYSIAEDPPKDTGVRVEEGLALSPLQLEILLSAPANEHKKVQLDHGTRKVVWNTWHTHLVWEISPPVRFAVRDGNTIHLWILEKLVTEKEEKFNPFFFLVAMSMVLLVCAYRLRSGPLKYFVLGVCALILFILAVALVIIFIPTTHLAPIAIIALIMTTVCFCIVSFCSDIGTPLAKGMTLINIAFMGILSAFVWFV